MGPYNTRRPREINICTLESMKRALAFAKIIGVPTEDWPGSAYLICEALLEAKLVDGRLVYGGYYGTLDPMAPVFGERRMARYQMHGWIEKPDREIIDPVRWLFEDKPAYIYDGANDVYDEGNEHFRSVNRPRAPPKGAGLQVVLDEPRVLLNHMRGLIAHHRGFNVPQLCWIFQQPYGDHGPFVRAVYRLAEKMGLQDEIPGDYLLKAKSEYGE